MIPLFGEEPNKLKLCPTAESIMSDSHQDAPRELSFYDYVSGQLSILIPRFGLECSRIPIMQSFETICRECLAFPFDGRPPEFSTINQDGTPFQFALALGPLRPDLQFLSEVLIPGSFGVNRIRLSRERIRTLASYLDNQEAVSRVEDLLDEMAPETSPELLSDPAGAFWIGVSFAVDQRPRLRVYINTRWGSERGMWARFRRFASYFGALGRWRELESRLSSNLKPLGMALTLRSDGAPTGRIYVSGYGNPLSYYERMMQPVTDETFKYVVRRYTEFISDEERQYPTRSVVCSFGFESRPTVDFKFELCGHCLFASDTEAVRRLRNWLESASVDPAIYLDVLDVLSEGHLSGTHPDLHCYVGVGVKEQMIYSSVYLKPKLLSIRSSNAA